MWPTRENHFTVAGGVDSCHVLELEIQRIQFAKDGKSTTEELRDSTTYTIHQTNQASAQRDF